jgi:uncharacterized repeat protein (TIGR03803 family)
MKNISQSSKRTVTVALTLLVFFLAGVVVVPSQAQTPTVLYNFMNGASDAAFPAGNIVQGRDGFMYGVGAADGRGTHGTGAVYKISPAGVEKVFFNFPATFVGCNSGLTLGTDGNFYGTCADNTATGQGSIYRLTPAAVFTDMHDFASGGGFFPPIQASDGNFYGVIASGIYKMTPAGVFTMIHTFASPDAQPASNLTQASDGNLYGTLTLCSNGNRGCVYKVSTAGVFAEVYLFVDATGFSPCTGVIQGTDGKLYGATDGGGANSDGDLYSVTTAGVEVDLHNLNNATDGACNPGSFAAVNMLQVNDGNFYGINYGGGVGNGGSIYKLTAAHVFSVFLLPDTGVDGVQPYSTLIQNTNGKVYGTANSGGTNSTGTFFSVGTGDAAFVLLQETAGKVGSKIGILGQGFSASSVVKFNGVTATTVTRTGATFLLATVPVGATDGFVTVTNGTTTLTSSKTFVVHNSWSSGAAMPTAREGAATGVINGKVYVVGGATASAIVGSNEIYNPTTNTWTTGAAIPKPMFIPASAVVKNILYLMGGIADSSQTPQSTVQAYDPSTNTWSTKASMPTANDSANAVVLNNLIYVVGGYDGSRSGLVQVYDPATDTWSTASNLLVAKSGSTLGVLGTTIVSSGGLENNGNPTGDTEGYSSGTNTWSALTSDATPRNGGCGAAVLGQLYLTGGSTSNVAGAPTASTESFNLTKDAWTTLMPAPQAVINASPALANSRLYCFGGANDGRLFVGTVYNDVQIYQP